MHVTAELKLRCYGWVTLFLEAKARDELPGLQLAHLSTGLESTGCAMTPGTIFVSHRAEYGSLVRGLRKSIESTSRGKIKVLISEDLPGAEKWRAAIKSQLEEAESLFLVYGAAYEDWSWCFYEAGFFSGIDAAEKQSRRIYCIARPNVPPPGPLNDLQMVTDKEQLITDLIEIYDRNNVEYDPAKLRECVALAAKGLFRKLDEFVSYPRVYFAANEGDFDPRSGLPARAVLKGERVLLTQLFGIGRDEVLWSEILEASADRTPQEAMVFSKWAEETKRIVLAARQNKFIVPQTVLIVRGGLRFRFLLYQARVQGDGSYSCEFLVINEVGGPTMGLSQNLAALLTTIRMGFRFRYELIQHFDEDVSDLSDVERQARIQEIPRIIDNLLTESEARGNVTLQDLQGAFDDDEARRIGKLASYWPILKDQLYVSLCLSPDGKPISDQGLLGPNAEKYQFAFEALRLLNIEFLSRCVARVSRMIVKSEEELRKNAETLECNVRKLSQRPMRPAA
jgi:hypothetical protein